MNNRTGKRKQQNQSRNKRLLLSILSLVLLAAIGLGAYFLAFTPDSKSNAAPPMKEDFAGMVYTGFDVSEIEELEAPEEVVQGTVENAVESKPEEPVKTETVIIPPKKDSSLMIANAKAHVYTIYTDLEQGSGFLFNTQGDIVTSAHVVRDASYIVLKNSDGQEFSGQIAGISETEDIALVRVEELAGKQPMGIATSPAEPGTEVVAIGSPGDVSNTVTEGEITATGASFSDGYEYTDMYEMTAVLKKGSSGGPLIDLDSEKVLGINSIILEDKPEIGYAIPMYTVVDQLNAWAADPITYEEEEIVLPDVKDAFFEETILRDFITAYYELLPYSLNDPELAYYESYLLPDSQGATEGKNFVETNRSETRTFDAVVPSIDSVVIGEEEALVEARATLTYHDEETGETATIEHTAIYTVVIDGYGDYQIKNIEMK
ncbi:Putative serine protease HhoA precursor [Planococcus massiliensis]|uniref:Putative serine protease HhoA n=1 Tax=Planococcus massiliensis TaxID=1499687 RepID=A0A098EI72_9BACL|nr:S1C family serine protease [Planococcus massiliensis]CEG21999.1 Putative serine protease HhoA precursor [Planococcus massiliensis]